MPMYETPLKRGAADMTSVKKREVERCKSGEGEGQGKEMIGEMRGRREGSKRRRKERGE